MVAIVIDGVLLLHSSCPQWSQCPQASRCGPWWLSGRRRRRPQVDAHAVAVMLPLTHTRTPPAGAVAAGADDSKADSSCRGSARRRSSAWAALRRATDEQEGDARETDDATGGVSPGAAKSVGGQWREWVSTRLTRALSAEIRESWMENGCGPRVGEHKAHPGAERRRMNES